MIHNGRIKTSSNNRTRLFNTNITDHASAKTCPDNAVSIDDADDDTVPPCIATAESMDHAVDVATAESMGHTFDEEIQVTLGAKSIAESQEATRNVSHRIPRAELQCFMDDAQPFL